MARGSTTVMVSPPPVLCEAMIRPPCARTIAATMDSPRPVPPFSRLRDGVDPVEPVEQPLEVVVRRRRARCR